MGMHERLEEQDDDDRLPQRFVAQCVATWEKYGQPLDELGKAMLAEAINLLLADASEPAEVAHILAGLAVQISPPEVVGHG